jgi:Dihydrodipicolinate synthetase family
MKGLFGPVVTPIGNDGRVEEATFDQVIEFLLSMGIHGLWLGGARQMGVSFQLPVTSFQKSFLWLRATGYGLRATGNWKLETEATTAA